MGGWRCRLYEIFSVSIGLVPEAAASVSLLLERLPQDEAAALQARLCANLSSHFEPPNRLPLIAAVQLCQLYRQHPGLLPR